MVKTYLRLVLAEYMGLGWFFKFLAALLTLLFAGAFCVVVYLYLSMFHLIPSLPGKD